MSVLDRLRTFAIKRRARSRQASAPETVALVRRRAQHRHTPDEPAMRVEVRPEGVHPLILSWGTTAWLIIGLGVLVWGIFSAMAAVQAVLVAVFLGLVLSSLLMPFVDWLSRHGVRRGGAVFIALLTFFLALGGTLTWIVNSVVSQWNTLASQLSDGVNSLFEWASKLAPKAVDSSSSNLQESLQTLISQGSQWIQSNAAKVATIASSSASAIALTITMCFLGLFCSIFFMLQGRSMWLWFLNLLPAKARQHTHDGALAGWYSFSGYARGTIIIALIDGLLAAILLMVCRVPLAAPLAALVTIGAFIPLIGAPTAMIIAALVALATRGIIVGIIILLGVALIGQIEGHILSPLIMSRQVSLHPIVTALGVTMGTFVAGMIGAIVAVPFISICWEVYKVLRTPPDPPLDKLPRPDLVALDGTAVGRDLRAKQDKRLNERAEAGADPIVAVPASHDSGVSVPAQFDDPLAPTVVPDSEVHTEDTANAAGLAGMAGLDAEQLRTLTGPGEDVAQPSAGDRGSDAEAELRTGSEGAGVADGDSDEGAAS